MYESSRRIIKTGNFATGCAISSKEFTPRLQNNLSTDYADLHRFPVWLSSRAKSRDLSNQSPAFLIGLREFGTSQSADQFNRPNTPRLRPLSAALPDRGSRRHEASLRRDKRRKGRVPTRQRQRQQEGQKCRPVSPQSSRACQPVCVPYRYVPDRERY